VLCAAGAVSFCFGGFFGFCLSGLGLSGFGWLGGTAGVAGVAGFCAGGCAGCAGTAGTARGCCVSFVGPVVPPPLEFVAGGAAEAGGACTASLGGPDVVVPPPPLVGGWSGAGVPGAGVPGTGEPGAGVPGTGEPGEGEPGAGDPGASVSPPPDELELFEAKIGMNPANGDDETDGLATCGLRGSTSEGTLRICEPGRATSWIAALSSVDRAFIQSWADATAPAATAPT
jgi:hypothetical protein